MDMVIKEKGNPFNPYRLVAVLLDEAEATTTGKTLDASRIRFGSLAVSGTFVGTVQVEGTLDSTNYFQIGGNITSPSLVQDLKYLTGIRAKVSAWTSGKITVKYAGRA